MSKKSLKGAYWGLLAGGVLCLACGIAVDGIMPEYFHIINGALSTEVTADEEYVNNALANSKQVNIDLESEGATLLKNENNLLPLTASTKINVYGILSAHHYIGGSGSASNNAKGTDLKTALESEGFEVNETIWNLIESKELAYDTSSGVGNSVAGQYELPLSEYEAVESFEDAKAYSDIALVTFGTNGGEGSDGDRNGDTNSNELGENEKALLVKLKEEGFRVICLINSSYVMELGPVKDYADSILWIGATGLYGTYGIAEILSGKVNPSGRLVDTWMVEEESSSTYYTSNNADSLYVNSEGKTLGAYTNCNEGIYVGYKWYETADAEGYFDNVSNSYGTGYEGTVLYPFGYGLSYTTFEEKLTAASQDGNTFTFDVEAENTGSVAGKDVFELYCLRPYTEGGVEKSVIDLVAYGKTALLAPGETETQKLEVTVDSLASYDVNLDDGVGGYVLDGGDYTFVLASSTVGAHAWKEEANDSDRSYTFTLDEVEYTGDNKRPSDAVTATNQLETTDNDSGISSTNDEAGFQELSRKNNFENASEVLSAEANANGQVTLADDDPLAVALSKYYGTNTYKNYNADHFESVAEVTSDEVDQDYGITLADIYTTDDEGNPLYEVDETTAEKTYLGDVDYDDSRWEKLLSEMSLDEIGELIGRGGYGNIAIESIGKSAGTDYDGPGGFSNFLKASLGIEQETTGFCSEPIIAATFSDELAYEFGQAVAMEGNAFGNTGWYAPGMNLHRTPFEGRTNEYFSEDPYLTGMMGGDVASGAISKGVYTYAKHFAFNELEANRESGANVWMNEQTARETYLRPFEIAIKQGSLTGLMSSFMYMNSMWNGANYNLMHNILREEWDFNGAVVTDLAGSSVMGAEKAIAAGTDMLLATAYSQNARSAYLRCDDIKGTSVGVRAMKTAAKHILYTYARGALHREVKITESSNRAQTIFIVANVLFYLAAAVLFGLFIYRLILHLKMNETDMKVVGGGQS